MKTTSCSKIGKDEVDTYPYLLFSYGIIDDNRFCTKARWVMIRYLFTYRARTTQPRTRLFHWRPIGNQLAQFSKCLISRTFFNFPCKIFSFLSLHLSLLSFKSLFFVRTFHYLKFWALNLYTITFAFVYFTFILLLICVLQQNHFKGKGLKRPFARSEDLWMQSWKKLNSNRKLCSSCESVMIIA